MTARHLRALALPTGASIFLLSAASVVLIALHPATDLWAGWGFAGYDAAFALVFGTVGLLVTTRRPGNVVGWLFLLFAVLSGAQAALNSYAQYAIVAGWPGGAPTSWILEWVWLPELALLALILLLFPDGRHVSPRWRALAIALAPVTVAVTLLWAVASPTVVSETVSVATSRIDPLGLGPTHPLRTVTSMSTLLLAAALLAGAISLRSRMRRGGPTERQQIKWIAFAGAFLGPAFAATFAASMLSTLYSLDPVIVKATEVLTIVVVLLIPVAAGIAILRYRLYDIDVLINRTIVYGAVTAILAATYFMAVVLFQALLRPFTSGNEFSVAASTLLVVALFQPFRRRVRDAVDRRFYRSRYDAARTLDAFGLRLRDEVDLDSLSRDLIDVARETVRPAHASLWLRR